MQIQTEVGSERDAVLRSSPDLDLARHKSPHPNRLAVVCNKASESASNSATSSETSRNLVVANGCLSKTPLQRNTLTSSRRRSALVAWEKTEILLLTVCFAYTSLLALKTHCWSLADLGLSLHVFPDHAASLAREPRTLSRPTKAEILRCSLQLESMASEDGQHTPLLERTKEIKGNLGATFAPTTAAAVAGLLALFAVFVKFDAAALSDAHVNQYYMWYMHVSPCP